jgi:hypothetical protein
MQGKRNVLIGNINTFHNWEATPTAFYPCQCSSMTPRLARTDGAVSGSAGCTRHYEGHVLQFAGKYRTIFLLSLEYPGN